MNNIALSLEQIDDMKHAIGLDNSKVKRGKYKAYRNYYTCGDNESWNELVKLELATVRNDSFNENSKVYFVSRKGMDYLEKLLGITIKVSD